MSFKISVYTKIFISEIKALMIGSAILDIWAEENNKKIKFFPSLNPYYYKIRRLEK